MESRDIEAALVAAGFPVSYARDTAFYITSFASEDEAHAYRFAHTDTFMDDLDWAAARAFWKSRASGQEAPSPDELRLLARRWQ